MNDNGQSKQLKSDFGAAQRVEALQRENEALSQQVKMLIKAEGKLYEYQQELDEKLNDYKDLYEFNRKLNATVNLDEIFRETVAYLTQKLEYERAVIFRKVEDNCSYRVCVLDGYYDEAQRDAVQQLVLGPETPCLAGVLNDGQGSQVCTDGTAIPDCCLALLMSEYFVYRIGHQAPPAAILMVGNSAENITFYRRVNDSPESMAVIGNIMGLLSAVAENRIFYEKLEQAREQERRAEKKYRSIFENAIEGIFQRTPQGKYLDLNQSLARMLGYPSPREVIDRIGSIRDQLYVDPGDHDRMIALLQEKGSVEAFETQMYRKDGRPMWISISMRMVRDDLGEVAYYEGTTEEITERKKGEEALRESEQRYRQLSEDLEKRVQETVDELRQKDRILILQGRQAVMGEMISNIAHQWRQPLNMLALLVQDLQITCKRHGLTAEFVEDNVARSLEIIRQMSKTIDYFRYFFMPDKEKVEFRVAETIEKTLAILEGSFKVHGIQTEVLKSADPVVTGYPNEFIQVLLNILINARDALAGRKPAEPRITVRLGTEGERTVLSIADNAGGVPEEIMDRIFDPYFTTKGPEQGTGIGLFMCKTIIEKNMGGRLSVRNVQGGAEFRIEV